MRDHPSPDAGAGTAERLAAAEVGRTGRPEPSRPVDAGRTLKEAEARTRELEADLADQERILERIARGEPLAVTLETLCRRFESRYPDARCSVLHLDPDAGILRHAAAPSLPESFRTAIDGLAVGEGMGACGTAAARNEIVVVADTSIDPLTESFRELAETHALRSVWSKPLVDHAGTVIGTFAVYRSVVHRPDADEIRNVRVAGNLAAIAIERQRAEDAATAAARLDPLTGLTNRAQFLEHLDRRMHDPSNEVGVLFCDLDRFKWINDSLGHPSGDRILVEVADRLRAVVRSGDLLARFGGDEFSLLVVDATPASATATARQIQGVFEQPFVLDSGEFFLSVSTGIAFDHHDDDAIGLVRDADAAMYAAKARGRARYALFDDDLRHRTVARATLESELRRAIERDELVIDLQPECDLATGEWVAVEALARWRHPRRGMLGPDRFVPLAEETGLIIPLGLRVLELAVAEAARLAAVGRPLVVAANVSVLQLNDPGFAAAVEAVVDRSGIDPSALGLEVTESAVMADVDVARAALERMVAQGVTVVIDDFGIGYSSIARLGELPVVGVKIDRQFTRCLGSDPRAERIFTAVAALAHAFELDVVAQGIESPATFEVVRRLGCERGQGIHLAPPVPSEQLDAILADHPWDRSPA